MHCWWECDPAIPLLCIYPKKPKPIISKTLWVGFSIANSQLPYFFVASYHRAWKTQTPPLSCSITARHALVGHDWPTQYKGMLAGRVFWTKVLLNDKRERYARSALTREPLASEQSCEDVLYTNKDYHRDIYPESAEGLNPPEDY